MKKKVLFIDRDGTIIAEPPITYQVDNLEQLEFLPGVIRSLYRIQTEMDFELILVTNQDGLGTEAYPQKNFDTVQQKMLDILKGEGIHFSAIHIDTSFEHENKNTRKPNTGMLSAYLNGSYDLAASFVIGDRLSDIQLAKNMGTQAIFIATNEAQSPEVATGIYTANNWEQIVPLLQERSRTSQIRRQTKETDISIQLNLEGSGQYLIKTGIGFFDHMLEQLAKHSCIDIALLAKGDLHIDEHHTVEDAAIVLGTAFKQALGKKIGLERYGFCLPMDDALAQVAIDFGGRNWIEWDASFVREKVGDLPTELFFHFFKSFSDAASCNLNIQASGNNEHHKIEAIFKAFARALKMAIRIDPTNMTLATTKGIL